MKAFLLSVATVVLLSLNGFAQEIKDQNFIEVSVRTEKQVTPDEIYLAITLNESESKGKTTVEQQEREMVKTLKILGIDVEKNLTVQDMNSDLKTYFLRKDNILATKAFTLKLNTARQMAQVFQSLNQINISDIRLQKTAVSEQLQKEIKDELLTSAAKKAQENAQILAAAVGSKAGKAIYLQNYYSFSQPQVLSVSNMKLTRAAGTMEIADDSAPALEINKTVISVIVLWRFTFEN